MAVSGDLFKLVWGGKLFTDEQWACGMYINVLGSTTATAADFEAALSAFHSNAYLSANQHAKLDYIKFNQVNVTTGNYLSTDATDVKDVIPPVVGGSQGAPGQTAGAISLRTDIARGRGSKGRIFIPGGIAWLGVTSAGHNMGVDTAQVANATAVLVNSLNATSTGRVVVWSKIAALAMPVTKILVGDVCDTQRRRRSSLKEVYAPNTTAIV